MYRQLKTRSVFYALAGKKPLTRHGTGKIEKVARGAVQVFIGLVLTAGVFGIMYISRYPYLFRDLLPPLILATIIPAVVLICYLLGLFDADAEIYRDKQKVKDNDTEDMA